MEELVIKAKQGDIKALEDIFTLMKNDLYKIARARFSNVEDAEDAIQETIIAVMKYMNKIKETENFKNWVIKILINQCNLLYKKKKKYGVSLDDIELSNIVTENTSFDKDTDFYLMLRCLEYKERIIMILYYSEGYAIKEIGKILKMNENTVKTKMLRSKLKIKDKFLGGEENGRIRQKNSRSNEK